VPGAHIDGFVVLEIPRTLTPGPVPQVVQAPKGWKSKVITF